MNANKILVISIITSLILIGLAMPEGEGQGGTREFRNVHMNLKANDGLSPETVHRNDTEAQKKRVNAEYTPVPGGGIMREYTDVGRWTSDSIPGDMTLQGRVTFNLWVLELEDSSDTCEFQFDLEHNGESKANVEISGVQLSANEVTEVIISVDLTNPIEAISGDTIGVYIQYNGWHDIEVYYDNLSYDSGASVSMDSLIIFEADSKVSARFYDAWGLNWNREGKYFCAVDIEGNITQGDEETEISDGGEIEGENETTYQTTKITFKDINPSKGDSVTVMIAYGPLENGTSEAWTLEAGSGGGGGGDGDDDDDDFPIAMAGAAGGVGILAVIGIVLFMRKKKAEGAEESEDEEYYDEEEYEEEYDDEDEE